MPIAFGMHWHGFSFVLFFIYFILFNKLLSTEPNATPSLPQPLGFSSFANKIFLAVGKKTVYFSFSLCLFSLSSLFISFLLLYLFSLPSHFLSPPRFLPPCISSPCCPPVFAPTPFSFFFSLYFFSLYFPFLSLFSLNKMHT